MDETLLLAAGLTAIALFFDFWNGFHDSANIVATMISSRAMSPQRALAIAAICEFVGAYFLGTAVAHTIGKDLIDPSQFEGPTAIYVVIAALAAAIGWNLFIWWYGFPSSSSHALIGGLLGAFVAARGAHVVAWPTVGKVFGILLLSPFVGGITCYVFMRIVLRLFLYAPPAANEFFRRAQTLSSMCLALSHGTNDAQKTMGVITMGLILLGYQDRGTFEVQHWVIIACSLAIALGIASGSWRIIQTLGGKIYRVRPIHGFSAQTTSALVLYGTAAVGFPVSTTQVITSSIMGAGASERINMVRWGVVWNILLTWVTTIPGAALAGAGAYLLLRLVVPDV